MMRRPPTLAANGMVAASHPLAAEAGLAALRAGGHAVDAAVAAAAVLSVVEPWASGLGGDAFFLIADQSDGGVSAINGSGPAPRNLTRERFSGRDEVPLRGPLSLTVPGAVAAWGEAWYGWGRLEWRDLIAPAAKAASEGFPVSWRMARILGRECEALRSDDQLAALYLRSDGSPRAAGDLCRNEALSRTLQILTEEDAESFYRGNLAEQLCLGVKAGGGVLDPADLEEYECPLIHPYELAARHRGSVSREFVLNQQPLPSQGILLLLTLGILDAGDQSARDGASWLELHRQIEAVKIAFALRDAFLADPAFLPVPEADLVEALLAPATLHRLARLLEGEVIPSPLAREVALEAWNDASTSNREILAAYRRAGYLAAGAAEIGPERGGDTTYLCTVDGEGNVVGLIQSIFHAFGCGFVEPETGVLFNNRACGFSLDPRNVNALAPGKRPRHTLNSTLIQADARPWMVVGTPGADQQFQTTLQVLRHVLHGSLKWAGPAPFVPDHWSQARRVHPALQPLPDPELLCAALEAPRWGLYPDERVHYESRFAAEHIRKLRKQGHPLVRKGPWEGSGLVQAIRCLENGVFLGATDPRGEGVALGF